MYLSWNNKENSADHSYVSAMHKLLTFSIHTLRICIAPRMKPNNSSNWGICVQYVFNEAVFRVPREEKFSFVCSRIVCCWWTITLLAILLLISVCALKNVHTKIGQTEWKVLLWLFAFFGEWDLLLSFLHQRISTYDPICPTGNARIQLRRCDDLI